MHAVPLPPPSPLATSLGKLAATMGSWRDHMSIIKLRQQPEPQIKAAMQHYVASGTPEQRQHALDILGMLGS